MSAAPTVSIVLPTHNGAKYLRQSIESCLGQTRSDLELVVVDDASTDETPAIIGSFPDPRVVPLRNERNMGLPASLNAGFARARGEYFTWTSDDNYYAPRAVERMLDFLRSEGEGGRFVYCDFYRLVEGRIERIRLSDPPELGRENGVGPCFLYSRAVRDAVGGYDEDAFLVEDYDYWIRVSKSFPMRRLAEPLYYYRLHAGSLSAKSMGSRDAKAAASLVRLKNGLTGVEAEYREILSAVAYEEYVRGSVLARIIGRLVRNATLGNVKLHELAARSLEAPVVRGILGDFKAGKLSLAQARLAIADALGGIAPEARRGDS